MIERRKKERHANRRIVFLLLLLILYTVFILLKNSGHLPIPDSYVKSSQTFIIAVIILLIANIVIKLTENRIFAILKNEIELEQSIFITKIYKTVIHLIAITIILSQLGVSTSNITIYLGFVTTGLALSLREILMSYFVWLIIIMKKPFRIGDYIVHGDASGTIIRIGTFFTTLGIKPGVDGNIVKIPNKILLDKPMRNYGSDGHIIDNIKIKLSSLPPNMDTKIKEMNGKLGKIVGRSGPEDLYLDMEGNSIVLIASYRVSLEEKYRIQTRVISCIYSEMKKFI